MLRKEKDHTKHLGELDVLFEKSSPGGIQTHDLQNRNLTFYSAELRGQEKAKLQKLKPIQKLLF